MRVSRGNHWHVPTTFRLFHSCLFLLQLSRNFERGIAIRGWAALVAQFSQRLSTGSQVHRSHYRGHQYLGGNISGMLEYSIRHTRVDSCCPRGTHFIYTPTYSRMVKCRVCNPVSSTIRKHRAHEIKFLHGSARDATEPMLDSVI